MPTPKCAMKCGTVFDKSYKGTIHASNGRFVCDSCYNELSGLIKSKSDSVITAPEEKKVVKVHKEAPKEIQVETVKVEPESKVNNVEELKKEFEDGESSLF